ncbi:hypothetical protein ABK040_001549 [Willaertia magna]
MNPLIILFLFFFLISLSWLIPYLLQKLNYFKNEYDFQNFCNKYNITEIGFGYITFEFDNFYKILPKHLFQNYKSLQNSTQKFLKLSFTIGVYICLFISLICILFLILHLFYFIFTLPSSLPKRNFNKEENLFAEDRTVASANKKVEAREQERKQEEEIKEEEELTNNFPQLSMVMLIPGINLPLNQLPILFISLFICIIFHEFGHAIAANDENINVECFGICINYLIFPSAYVSLPTNQLEKQSIFVKLKIYCGGVWFNFKLCFIFFILLLLFFNANYYTSFIERPSYKKGVFIKQVNINNPLYDELSPNKDIIVSINDCPVNDVKGFINCLSLMKRNKGFKITNTFKEEQLLKYKNKCCKDEKDDDDSRLLCFTNDIKENLCMKARELVDNFETCQSLNDHNCFIPQEYNILSIGLINRKEHLLFYGDIDSFYNEVIVSDVRLKEILSFLSIDFIFQLQKLIEYTIALSLGLAVFNLAPVELLDGAKILECLFLFFSKYYNSRDDIEKMKVWYSRILFFFKWILCLNIVAAFINAFKNLH